MALIHRLLQELSKDELLDGESQVFIGHEFRRKDLRVKVERSLKNLGLHAYFADKHQTGGYILDKICKKIVVARASIVDLSYANPNVYFELGISIGLNKPVFVVLKRGATVPPLLDSFVKLRFSTHVGLENDLVKQLPGWLAYSVDHHMLYGHHCQFVDVLCPDRQRMSPKRTCLVIDEVVTQEDGQPRYGIDADFKAELLAALSPFQFAPVFLDDLQVDDTFRLCAHCRQLRDCTFAVGHLTHHTSPNAYLLLGLATGLGLAVLLVAKRELDAQGRPLFEVPELLRGLDRTEYEHLVDLSDTLQDQLEDFISEHKRRPTRSKILLFPDSFRREALEKEASGRETAFHPDAEGELDPVLTMRAPLARIEVEIAQGAEVDTVCKTLAEAIRQLFASHSATIYIVDSTSGDLVGWIAKRSGVEPTKLHRESLTATALRIDTQMIFQDVMASPDYAVIRGTDAIQSWASVPLTVGTQTLGMLSVAFLETHQFTDEKQALLHELAESAAAAIRKADLANQLPSGAQGLHVSQSTIEGDSSPDSQETIAAKRHILIVEDEPVWQDVLTLIIEQSVTELGYTPVIHVAGNSLEARRIFEDLATCELVITGVNLKGTFVTDMSGIDFARWVKQRRPDTAIVVVTASAGPKGLRTLFRDIGVLDVIDKGRFEVSELEDHVASVLGGPLRHTPSLAPRPLKPSRLLVDRDSERNAIFQAVEKAQSVAIIGAAGIGKTSLLLQIQNSLEARGHHCIYVSFQSVWSEQGFYDSLRRSLMRVGIVVPGDASEASTVGIESALIEHGEKPRIVLLMDEFDTVVQGRSQSEYSGRFFGWLRSLADRGLISMVISSRIPVSEWTMPEFGSPFSNILRVVQLGPLDRTSALQLLTSNIDRPLNEEELTGMLDMARGSPLALSVLSEMLSREPALFSGRVDHAKVIAQIRDRLNSYLHSVDKS